MMQRLFRASNSIASAALVLGLAGLLSRLLGVYRDRLLATTFGAGQALDAYYAAFRLPDFIFNILVLGALSAGFIPIFSERLARSKEEAFRVAQAVFSFLLVALGVLSVVVYVLAPWLMPLLAPGFDAETLDLTTGLTRIMLLSPILLGMSSVLGGILQSYKRFLAYSLAPIFYNLGIILGIVFLIKPFGIGGLAAGVVLGSALHLFMQYAVARKLGWTFAVNAFWREHGLRQIVNLMGHRTLALAIAQLNLVVITVIASGLEQGRLAIMTLAQNLAHVPIGLFGVSFAVAAFPVLAEQAIEPDNDRFSKTLVKTTGQILFFIFPTLIVFALFDEQIVRLVLGAGEFTWEATLLTARALLFFIPGILAQGLLPLFARAFYAQKNTRQPLLAAVMSLLVNFILAAYFAKRLDVAGLALAFSLSSLVQILLLAFWQRKFILKEHKRQLWETVTSLIAAGVGMVFVMQTAKHFSGPLLDLFTVKGVLLHLLLPLSLGSLAFFYLLKSFGLPEYLYVETMMRSKLKSLRSVFLPV